MNKDIKYLGIPNICFSLTDKNDPREEEFKKQRIKRGFDESELWALNNTIALFILPRLKTFKKELWRGNDKKFERQINKMIYSFELCITDPTISFKKSKKYKKGMKLFAKHFLELWY